MNKKIGMAGIISNPVKSLNSHNGGWTMVCKSILENHFNSTIDVITEKDNWDDYEVLVINEGVNFKPGSYNFFGGVQDSTINKLNKYFNFKGEIYSINSLVDYNEMCSKRKELKNETRFFRDQKVIDVSKVNNKLILGDSHSVSIYKPGYSISRNDGKTLFGFLKDPTKFLNGNYSEIITYFGNIDIRFHICRQLDPISALDDLVSKYVDFCFKYNATPVCLLPIESEDRKIPKTGLYLGQPFFGSRSLRRDLVKRFNEKIQSHFLKCYVWPDEWYEEDFDFTTQMEARQSVHLRPSSYSHINRLVDNNLIQTSLF